MECSRVSGTVGERSPYLEKLVNGTTPSDAFIPGRYVSLKAIIARKRGRRVSIGSHVVKDSSAVSRHSSIVCFINCGGNGI
jgi:hypothetical protein